MRVLIVGFISLLLLAISPAQTQDRHQRYIDRADVRHVAGSVFVVSNDPRPLSQALVGISEEYARLVDFEDPPYYSKYDLVDDTSPQWRATHPTEKGVTVIGGEFFQTEFPESPDAGSSAAGAEHILENVVSDYNASTNPGRFTVRDEGDGRFAIVGTELKDEDGKEQAVTPILDTLISIPTESRDAITGISAILDALSAKTHTKVILGMMPISALQRSKVTVGGDNTSARNLLLQMLSATKLKLSWHLYYDNDVKMYALNLLPLRQAQYDASGNRTTIDIWLPKRASASAEQ
jgi:hypothetical protein